MLKAKFHKFFFIIQCLCLFGLGFVSEALTGGTSNLEGVSVRLMTVDGAPVTNELCTLRSTTPPFIHLEGVSSDEGLVTFRGTIPNAVKLSVCHTTGYASRYYGETIISMTDAQCKDGRYVFVLKKYTPIRGRVESEEGLPLDDFSVQLALKADGRTISSARVRTGDDGEFQYDYLMFEDGMSVGAYGGEKREKGWTYYFEIETENVEKEIVLVAKKAPPLPPSVDCSIVDTNGQLVKMRGYFHALGPMMTWRGLTTGPKRVGGVQNGKFKLQGYPNGQHELTLHATTDGKAKVMALRNHEFELPCAGNALEFVLEKEVQTQIYVLDRETKQPIKDSVVQIEQLGNVSKYKSDEKGVVSCAVWPLPFFVKAFRSGYLRTAPVEVKMPGKKVFVHLNKGAVLKGAVFSKLGEPIPDAQVVLFPPAGGEQYTNTDINGLFFFEALNDGQAKLIVSADGYAKACIISDTVREGPVEVLLDQGAEITFNITFDITMWEGEKIATGGLAILKKPEDGILHSFPCAGGVLQEKLRLSHGDYELIWVGQTNCFIVDSIKVNKSKVLNISQKQPNPENFFPRSKLVEMMWVR